MVRVIGGAQRGRRLKVPASWSGRPTADRVKEALFNILAPVIKGSNFLDLFAGSGNVGIEALSRGAERVVFAEKDSRMVKIIASNLHMLSLSSNSLVMKEDAFAAIRMLSKKGECFDLIFVDPPYDLYLGLPVLEKIFEYKLIKSTGLVILESSKREVLPFRVKSMILARQKKYGDTLLTIFREG